MKLQTLILLLAGSALEWSAFAGGTYANRIFTINSSSAETISQQVPNDATNVVKTGSARATLSKPSQFVGPVNINQGSLALSSADYLGVPSAITVKGSSSELYLNGCDLASWTKLPQVTLTNISGNFPYLTFANLPVGKPAPFGIHATSGGGRFVAWEVGAKAKGMNTIAGTITIDSSSSLACWMRSYFYATISGPFANCNGTFTKTGQGTLWLTTSRDRSVNKLTNDRGDLILDKCGKLTVTGSDVTIGYSQGSGTANLDAFANIVVDSGSSLILAKDTISTSIAGSSSHYGLLTVKDGGVVSNRLNVGSSGIGAVHQFGGTVYLAGQPTKTYSLLGDAASGYGCYYLGGGEALSSKDTGINVANLGTGYVIVKDGARFVPNYSYNLGQGGGTAHVYVNGIWWVQYSCYAAQSVTASTKTVGSVALTADGPNALIRSNFINHFGSSDSKAVFCLNVNNGGRVESPFICRGRARSAGDQVAKYYINANGGILTAERDGEWNLQSGQVWVPPDRLTVFKGGVTFDMGSQFDSKGVRTARTYSPIWRVPIMKPTGKGIKSITLPAEVTNLKYWEGPARLTISSTTGAGASAICDYEPIDNSGKMSDVSLSQYGVQKGVIVTSPGWGYAEGDVTCTVHHQNMSLNTEWPCTVELEDNDQTGGVTFIGGGTFTMAEETVGSDYLGPTRIESGTVVFKDQTYSIDSPLDMAGGTADFTAYEYGAPLQKAGGYGTVKGDMMVSKEFRVSCADLFGGKGALTCTGKLTFSAASRLVITDPENLRKYRNARRRPFCSAAEIVGTPLCDIEGFKLSVVGNTLYLGGCKGMVVISR